MTLEATMKQTTKDNTWIKATEQYNVDLAPQLGADGTKLRLGSQEITLFESVVDVGSKGSELHGSDNNTKVNGYVGVGYSSDAGGGNINSMSKLYAGDGLTPEISTNSAYVTVQAGDTKSVVYNVASTASTWLDGIDHSYTVITDFQVGNTDNAVGHLKIKNSRIELENRNSPSESGDEDSANCILIKHASTNDKFSSLELMSDNGDVSSASLRCNGSWIVIQDRGTPGSRSVSFFIDEDGNGAYESTEPLMSFNKDGIILGSANNGYRIPIGRPTVKSVLVFDPDNSEYGTDGSILPNTAFWEEQ